MAEQSQMTLPSSENSTFTPSSHKLHDTWNLWAHLPRVMANVVWGTISGRTLTLYKMRQNQVLREDSKTRFFSLTNCNNLCFYHILNATNNIMGLVATQFVNKV